MRLNGKSPIWRPAWRTSGYVELEDRHGQRGAMPDDPKSQAHGDGVRQLGLERQDRLEVAIAFLCRLACQLGEIDERCLDVGFR
jgi:hypothetical protein